jgi:hypothetical protein
MRYLEVILKSTFLVVLLTTSILASAQMKSGYRFGINLTTMTINSNVPVSEMRRPMGIHFGGNYDISLSRNFSLLYGFVFTSKGANYKLDNVDISLAPTYVEIPINLNYNIGSRSTKLSLYAGPYSSFTIGGYKLVSGGEYTYLKFGRGQNKDLRIFDFGFNFGVGIVFRGYLISAQIGQGLTNVSPSNNSTIRNNVIGISISSLKQKK